MSKEMNLSISPMEQNPVIVKFTSPNYKLYVKKKIPIKAMQYEHPFRVQTHQGIVEGKAGDWLMEGPDGECYPCDGKVFSQTYDVYVPENDR